MYLIFEPKYYTFTSLKFKGHPGSKNKQCVIVAKVSIPRSYSVIISLRDISHSVTEFHFVQPFCMPLKLFPTWRIQFNILLNEKHFPIDVVLFKVQNQFVLLKFIGYAVSQNYLLYWRNYKIVFKTAKIWPFEARSETDSLGSPRTEKTEAESWFNFG